MKPNQLSYRLRQIASAIDNSRNPSRELVLRDIRFIVASLGDVDQLSNLIKELGSEMKKVDEACNYHADYRDDKSRQKIVDSVSKMKNKTESIEKLWNADTSERLPNSKALNEFNLAFSALKDNIGLFLKDPKTDTFRRDLIGNAGTLKKTEKKYEALKTEVENILTDHSDSMDLS